MADPRPARQGAARPRLPAVGGLIAMTLKHGVYIVRAATRADEVATILTDLQPHLALIDMDLGRRADQGASRSQARRRDAPTGLV